MAISALDETGNPVDWWFIYKVPLLGGGANNDAATGYEYAYYDPNQAKVGKSPNLLSGGNGALNLTMNSVFNNRPATYGYVLYNDEMPLSMKRKDDGNLGHTKGVLAFDTESKTGYWLLHSWPKFADIDGQVEPTPIYGQTYLCLSLDIDSVRKIADQMAHHQEPQVYKFDSVGLPKTDPLFALTQKPAPKPPGDSNVLNLTTRGGMPFKVIAKNREWQKDFWNELVGPTLGEDMDVETWIRGEIPPMADSDGIHKTFDVKYINLGPLGLHWAWPETHDHAKWGITTASDWVCVGDINRMISQRNRGGGTIAFQNKTLWDALSRTNLLIAPPGHSRTNAHTVLIKNTHKDPNAPQNPAVTPQANPPAGPDGGANTET